MKTKTKAITGRIGGRVASSERLVSRLHPVQSENPRLNRRQAAQTKLQSSFSARSRAADRLPRTLMPKVPKLKSTRSHMNGLSDSISLSSPARMPSPAVRPVELAPVEERRGYESASALNLYMREVGQTNLLTPAEEVALARRVLAGDEEAREHMIRANLRLVVKIAREYENLGLPLLDLINEGNIGLMKAVEKFDPDKGAKLSSYSSWWIKQSIRRALANQSKTIRLPVNAVDQIYHLRKASVKLQEILGREPNDGELAHEVGLSVRRVAELRDAAIRPASLDAPLGDEDSSTLGEVVADENAVNPYQCFEDRNSLSKLGELIARLPERESRIIRSRFGLDDGREKTLEEIGAKFRLTRERIRQLQNLALTKLRRMLEEPEAIEVAA
jgi:RNA polymerase primary sigma factor